MNLKVDRLELIEKLQGSLAEKRKQLSLCVEDELSGKEFLKNKERILLEKFKDLDVSKIIEGDTDYSSQITFKFTNLSSTSYNPSIIVGFPELRKEVFEPKYKGENKYYLENGISSLEKGIAKLEMAKNELVTVSDKEDYFSYIN